MTTNATERKRLPSLAFGHDDAQLAAEVWSCNCGPSACAAAIGLTLEEVREPARSVGFMQKGYTSPTMMRELVKAAGGKISHEHKRMYPAEPLRWPQNGLVRVQWCGPWTEPGMNPRWAYGATHWVAACRMAGPLPYCEVVVFDINGGVMWFDDWQKDVVPEITKSIKRANGSWFLTHSWEVE